MTERLRLASDRVHWAAIDEKVIALDFQNSLYLRVNRSGGLLWAALSQGATREELMQALVSEYSLDEAAAGSDVDAFIAALRAQGLIVSGDVAAAPKDVDRPPSNR